MTTARNDTDPYGEFNPYWPEPFEDLYREVMPQPTPEALKAIDTFVKTGAWPKPGTMPTCIRLR